MTQQPEPKVNVLLVDDHRENLVALVAILSQLNQNLVQAQSGEAALRRILEQDFAVILLDVQMPGIDGFETAALIRQRARSRQIPIIFLTAFSTSNSMMFKGYSLGAVDYLQKPIEPEILLSKVGVFVELAKKTAEVARQAAQLSRLNLEMRQSEERFRALSHCSPLGVFLTDAAGICTYMNPRCESQWGFQLMESIAQSWLQSVPEPERQQVTEHWFNYLQHRTEYSQEFSLLQPPGHQRWLHMRASPMLSDTGDFLGHVGTIEEITERKQAETARAEFIREQAARQQAEAANNMKDEFLATLSHELRTPLNSILGWSRLLHTRKFDQATTERALEAIERNARLQAQLIEDILDVSRIIRGKLQLSIHQIHLAAVIDAAVEALRPAAEAKSISLVYSLEPAVNPVLADPTRFQQVVWNLLSNAIKFTPEEGQVTLSLSQTEQHVQLVVTDTGIGIKPEFLPYVFDRFRQADSTSTRSYGGLGLGLAIVRHLVELHGGFVQVTSAGEGQGATFTVNLPQLPTPPDAEPQPLPEDFVLPTTDCPSLSGLCVLVVDDDIDTCEFLRTALAQYGASVTAVNSATAALESMQQHCPDVLVSDIGMPGQDGYELIGQVRGLDARRGSHLPAIALTAYAGTENQSHVLTAGFQMHLAKPVEPATLATAIAYLGQQSAEASAKPVS